MQLAGILQSGTIEPCRPWPRHVLSSEAWVALAGVLAADQDIVLIGLWADTVQAHALLSTRTDVVFASTPVDTGAYPALSPVRPVAAWFERTVRDLWGHTAVGGSDARLWLDHGKWPNSQPMAPRPGLAGSPGEPPELISPDTDDHLQVPLGPVHGGLESASHLRVTMRGTTVERLETRLGYTHKGALTLMRGKSPRTSARFAARLAGESTVAHSIAFARATEAALGVEPPPLALALRAVMAEMERIAGHLQIIGSTGAVAGITVLAARCGRLVEMLRRAAAIAFGHRLMMDCVIPGGVATNIAPGGPEMIRRTLRNVEAELAELVSIHGTGAMTRQLRATGRLDLWQVQLFGAGGVIGRAAGRDVDMRRWPGYAPYTELNLPPRLSSTGDAAARAELRLLEIGDSVRMLHSLLSELPEGGLSIPLPTESGEAIGFAEGFHGDIWHWLRLDHGQIASVFTRDPAWAHWPLLELACAGQDGAGMAQVRASFGLTTSGVDL